MEVILIAKAVYCMELKREYPSISAAARELNLDSSQLAKVCKKQLRTVGGYHFAYIDEEYAESRNKEFSINKAPSDKSNPYYIVNKDSNRQAMKELSRSGFYLYTYFVQNEDGFVGVLRRTHVMRITGLSKSSFYNAMAELIEHGYLIDTGDGYEFYEKKG